VEELTRKLLIQGAVQLGVAALKASAPSQKGDGAARGEAADQVRAVLKRLTDLDASMRQLPETLRRHDDELKLEELRARLNNLAIAMRSGQVHTIQQYALTVNESVQYAQARVDLDPSWREAWLLGKLAVVAAMHAGNLLSAEEARQEIKLVKEAVLDDLVKAGAKLPWDDVARFLADDGVASSALLAACAVSAPPPGKDWLAIAAQKTWEKHQRDPGISLTAADLERHLKRKKGWF
jgi:hypothetical protein